MFYPTGNLELKILLKIAPLVYIDLRNKSFVGDDWRDHQQVLQLARRSFFVVSPRVEQARANRVVPWAVPSEVGHGRSRNPKRG